MWLVLSILFISMFIRLYTLCYINCNNGKYDKPGAEKIELLNISKSLIMLIIGVFCLFIHFSKNIYW